MFNDKKVCAVGKAKPVGSYWDKYKPVQTLKLEQQIGSLALDASHLLNSGKEIPAQHQEVDTVSPEGTRIYRESPTRKIFEKDDELYLTWEKKDYPVLFIEEDPEYIFMVVMPIQNSYLSNVVRYASLEELWDHFEGLEDRPEVRLRSRYFQLHSRSSVGPSRLAQLSLSEDPYLKKHKVVNRSENNTSLQAISKQENCIVIAESNKTPEGLFLDVFLPHKETQLWGWDQAASKGERRYDRLERLPEGVIRTTSDIGWTLKEIKKNTK